MDRLKGLGSSLVGAAGNMADRSGLSYLKESYLNKAYDIGSRKFIVKKLIAEGGFGFVFLVREQPAYGAPPNAPERLYALKRILVQDRERVDAIKMEVNLLKSLAREPHVVRLEDCKMNDSRHELEVLLLMELCNCSLLDAMNQGRVRSEQDIYEIFSQICEAVARLHSNNPPISHRDLKVENVLLGEDGKWKLCDFGSATTATYLANTERERSVAEEDINRNTTMMYRAPEMVDLYRRQPINEKVDIWALGCVLFKMAYMADAFDSGLGILNARYTFPEFRKTSTNFEEFIAYMLTSDPTERPNIHQVQERLATLRGVPFKPRPGNPAQTSPTSRSTNTNNSSRDTNTKRQPPAPAQKQPVVDLVDWGDAPTTTPPVATQAAQPVPQSAQQPTRHANSQPTKQASASLFDSLDWQTSSAPASKPAPASPASRQVAPKPSTPSNTQQRPHTASPVHPHIPKSTAPPSSHDGPDLLLDFSAPISKPAPQQPHFTSPPIASPTGFYSPQPHRPNYSLGPPAYYQPYQQGPGQYNRPAQGQDLLAQFALPKQQSTGPFDDFDPLATQLPSVSPQPSLHKPPQPSLHKPPQPSPLKPQPTQLPAPPAASQSRNKGPTGANDSLIFF